MERIYKTLNISLLKTLFYRLKTRKRIFVFSKASCQLHKTSKITGEGKLFVNISQYNFPYNKVGILSLFKNSQLVINGTFRFYSGSQVTVHENGKLSLGSGFINNDCKIGCRNSITIGDNVKIGDDVSIHDFDGHIISREGYKESEPIIIGDNVWIGKRATILKGVNIGKGSIVAAGAVVTKSFPPNSLIGGVPAKLLKSKIEWKG